MPQHEATAILLVDAVQRSHFMRDGGKHLAAHVRVGLLIKVAGKLMTSLYAALPHADTNTCYFARWIAGSCTHALSKRACAC